jgi:hypothetical protein
VVFDRDVVAVECAEPHRDLLAVRPLVSKQARAADRTERLHGSTTCGSVDANQLCALEQVKALACDAGLQQARRARVAAAERAVAVVGPAEGEDQLEAHPAAKTTAAEHIHLRDRISADVDFVIWREIDSRLLKGEVVGDWSQTQATLRLTMLARQPTGADDGNDFAGFRAFPAVVEPEPLPFVAFAGLQKGSRSPLLSTAPESCQARQAIEKLLVEDGVDDVGELLEGRVERGRRRRPD